MNNVEKEKLAQTLLGAYSTMKKTFHDVHDEMAKLFDDNPNAAAEWMRFLDEQRPVLEPGTRAGKRRILGETRPDGEPDERGEGKPNQLNGLIIHCTKLGKQSSMHKVGLEHLLQFNVRGSQGFFRPFDEQFSKSIPQARENCKALTQGKI